MPTQANQPLGDGYQLQNYRIRKVLSCGGFSIVYLAHDENDVPVAIKEYLPSSLALRNQGDVLPAIAEENLATFRYGMKCFFEEGKSLAGLSHTNVVRVLNFFRANETVYMVMRYERGRTLDEIIPGLLELQATHGDDLLGLISTTAVRIIGIRIGVEVILGVFQRPPQRPGRKPLTAAEQRLTIVTEGGDAKWDSSIGIWGLATSARWSRSPLRGTPLTCS